MALTLVLALAQVLYEEVVLFFATTGDGLSGPLASRLVAIGVPLAIATALLVLLLGGALWTDRASEGARSPLVPDEENGPRDGEQ